MSTKKITGGQLRKIIQSEVRTVREGMAPSREEQDAINPDPRKNEKMVQKHADRLFDDVLELNASDVAFKYRNLAMKTVHRLVADKLGMSRSEVAALMEDSDAEMELDEAMLSGVTDYLFATLRAAIK